MVAKRLERGEEGLAQGVFMRQSDGQVSDCRCAAGLEAVS